MSVISAIVKRIKETLMSLHDVDKNSPRRGKSSLNAPDLNTNPLAAGTTQAQNSIDTPQADGLKIKERQIAIHTNGIDRIVYGFLSNGGFGLASYDSTNQRLLIGPDSTGADVVKISKPGYDAYNATDANLILNSQQNVFKIVTKLQTTFSFTGVSTTTTTAVSINHGLGYKPLTLNVVELTTNSANSELGIFGLPYIGHGTTSGTGPSFIISAFVKQSNVTTSSISFGLGIIGSLTIAGTITSYVLQETAT